MSPSEVYIISLNSNYMYFYIHFYDERCFEKNGKSKVNTVYMKDRSCPEILLFIPSGNYNSPQYLLEQLGVQLKKNEELFYVKSTV